MSLMKELEQASIQVKIIYIRAVQALEMLIALTCVILIAH